MSETTKQTERPRLWKAREAAEFLAISERHLWSMTQRGEIPCVRLGECVRYDPADLRAMIEAKKNVVERTCQMTK